VAILSDDSLSLVAAPISVQSMLFCTIDPACGGSGSSFALITCCYVGDNCIVIGGEELGSSSAKDRENAILEHFSAIRARSEFAGSTIVVCVESNLGAEAEHYCNFLSEKNVRKVILMREDHDRYGWRTTNDTKKLGCIRMNSILNERRLKFYSAMTRVASKNEENTPAQLRHNIIEQLQSFMRIVIPQKNVWDDIKEKYTGKYGGRDDLAMAMQMSLLMYERFRNPERRAFYENPKPFFSNR